MNVKIYIEGGGDSKSQHVQCREGFRKLFENAGFAGRMPWTVAGGGRGSTFDAFKTAAAIGSPDTVPMLLVDSEDPVTAPTAWGHLQARDGWECPANITDDQAQLMVTCMETWIMADRAAMNRALAHPSRRARSCPWRHWRRGPAMQCRTPWSTPHATAAATKPTARDEDPFRCWLP